MARKKLIPTWVKVAAVAALFVPYKVEIDKDDNKKIKKVTTNSLAVRLSYTPARDGNESDLNAVIPGFNASKCKLKAGKKTYTVDGEQLMHNAKVVCGEMAEKVKAVAKRTTEGVISVEEPEEIPFEEDDVCFDCAKDAEDAEKAFEEALELDEE